MYNFMKKGAMMLLIAGLAMSVTNTGTKSKGDNRHTEANHL